MIWGSSQTDPNYSNYQGSQTYNFKPVASSGGVAVNAQGQPQLGGGNVLAASTQAAPSGSGNDASNITNPGHQAWLDQQALQGQPAQPSIDFDALIAPALQALDSYIPTVQSAYDTNVSDINAAKGTQLAGNQANIQGQTNTLNQARTSQQGMAESAADEARRQYSEIQQGLQSRYGGTTGTGAFASELAGRQTLQNIGKIRQGLSQAMLQIDDKLQQVQEIGRISQQDIEDKTREQINQAKQQLDTQLADVRNQKGALMSQKAQMAAQAMQYYQQTVNNVNAQNAAFKQNLYLQQLNAENQLKIAQQKGQGIASSYTAQDLSTGNQVTPVTTPAQQMQTGGVGGAGSLYDTLYKNLTPQAYQLGQQQ